MSVHVCRPWNYPMTPTKPEGKRGRPNAEECPENIARCLHCTRTDCIYDSIGQCIAADNRRGETVPTAKLVYLVTGTDWKGARA